MSYGFLVPASVFFLLASALLTKLMIAYARRLSIVDVPNERSSHALPTPRGGGLAVVVVFMAGLMFLAPGLGLSNDVLTALAGSGLMAAAVGFWDDHRHLPARRRALVHFLAAGWALYWLGGFPALASGFSLGGLAGNLFWLVALVWFLNAFNFMDGIDGIAGAEAAFISGAGGLILFWSGANSLAMAALLIAAVTAGFLVWNMPPARIFMGDVGSGFLGLVLGVLAIVSVREGAVPMWVFAILFGVFIADATITVLRRILRGARWHAAHKSHAYQHAARRFGGHGRVTLAVTAINACWLFPLAVAAWRWPAMGPVFTAVAYVPLIWLALHFRAGETVISNQ